MSIPDSFREVEFEIEKEVWNRYELTDNAELRIRCVLIKVLQGPDTGNPLTTQYTGETKNLTNVVPMEGFNLWGPKTTRNFSIEELTNARKIPVGFESIREDWNVYRLSNGTKLKMKLVVAGVMRLQGLYDAHGVPIYNIDSTVIVSREPRA